MKSCSWRKSFAGVENNAVHHVFHAHAYTPRIEVPSYFRIELEAKTFVAIVFGVNASETISFRANTSEANSDYGSYGRRCCHWWW